MRAPDHPEQEARLRALRDYEVLDTPRERDFDDLVNLAAAICETPISVVNLIDAERQWFKAETGLGLRETPIETSICSHVILEEDFVEIPDTLEDRRMQDNPLCCGDSGLRFYAGALLRNDAGLPIGTLCVLDYVPRELTPLQRDTLRVLARQVMTQLEMRKALRTADVLRREVDHRVKNSLQSLSSFARLQHHRHSSEPAKRALTSILTRIDALGRLHEQLHESDSPQGVALGPYLGKICTQLEGLAPPGVAVAVEADDVTVSPQQAVAVGTFVNEFLANSFKHAFPTGDGGTVSVGLAPNGAGTLRLTCADDGVGLPEEISKAQSGLGLRIAEVVCAELGGTLDLKGGTVGTVATLDFPARL